jgi:SAM-dependent methyltransferase
VNGLRINVGCGASPTPGWLNFDNSLTVRIGNLPFSGVLSRLGAIPGSKRPFFQKAAQGEIRWANAVRRIPVPDRSAEVVYSSHMLEHLDRAEARVFLREVLRVLAPSGKLRLVVPDLRKLIDDYISDGDADALVGGTHLAHSRLHSVRDRLRFLVVGYRRHLWMYDGPSLCSMLKEEGFSDPRVVPPGETTISDPGALNLRERDHESVYVEAEKGIAASAAVAFATSAVG